MTNNSSHNWTDAELDEMLGAYALDALDPTEHEAVSEYLERSPRALAEVSEHRESAAMLAFAGAPAPDGLWERIAGSLIEPPPPLQLVPKRTVRHRAMLRTLAVAAVAATVFVIGGLGVSVARLNSKLDERNSELAGASGLDRAMTDADAQMVELVSSDGTMSASVVMLPDGHGWLYRNNLPALGADKTYQLWGLMRDGSVVSLGVLGGDPTVSPFMMATSDLEALVLTVEDRGGVAVSDEDPTVAATLSA